MTPRSVSELYVLLGEAEMFGSNICLGVTLGIKSWRLYGGGGAHEDSGAC